MNRAVIFLIIIVVLSVFGYQYFLKNGKAELELVSVVRGDVIEEISETGQVKKEEIVSLNFKSSGIIEKIYIELGKEVKEGEALVKLEDSQLRIQLGEAEANLELNQAQFKKILAGASKEEIQVAQTSVDNAKIAVLIAEQALEDIKRDAENDLEAAYEDSLNYLESSYLKISDSLNTVDLVRRTYFTTSDQQGVSVSESKTKIENAKNQIEPYLEVARNTKVQADIDIALFETHQNLKVVSDALKATRDACEQELYKALVSLANKTSLDTHRSNINTALTNIANSQQAISSAKIAKDSNINTYQGRVDVDRGDLKAAEDNLTKVIAPPRQEDIDLYQAQVKQALSKVRLLEKQIGDTVLRTPVDGQIVKIHKSIGEMVQTAAQDSVIEILPDSLFGIKVDIYEEDVAKMDIGNEVSISLIAFSDKHLLGRVTFIDPTEKMIDGIVYYEVSISLSDYPLGTKPGMTADLIIKTESRENVLLVPESAFVEKNGKFIVEVFEGNKILEREVKIGLIGSEDTVEIISGLEKGEEVIIR